jgi:hypothetical protein
VDLAPTIHDYLGNDPKESDFDGASLRDLIEGDDDNFRTFALFEESYVQRKIGLRSETHKYIFAPDGKGMCTYCQKVHGGVEEFYDLKKDPEEMNNVISEYRMMADKMKQDLLGILQKLDEKKQRLIEKKELKENDREDLQDLADQKKIKKKLRSLGYMD